MTKEQFGIGKIVEDTEGVQALTQGVSEDESRILARLPDDKILSIPIDILTSNGNSKFLLPISFKKLVSTIIPGKYEEKASLDSQSAITIPVIEEVPVITKKMTETEKVKIKKTVTESPYSKDELLLKEEIVIEHVPRDEIRTEPAQIRYEGDSMIIPVQEEILVVEKKIKIREELHISWRRTETKKTVTMNLKSEDVTVERKKLN